MKFLDLFAGIGGFRMGLESLGHECVGFCEIDKFARKSYKAIYDTEGEIELYDITQVTNEEWRKLRGTVDIICGGFPCQAFSIAGKRKGFLDETRGTLFFEIARAAKEIQPPLLFLENVKGLLSHDQGRTFRTILSTLDELGYDAEWQVLNSKDFGVPQNRERVFIIGHLRGDSGREVFPIRGENGYANENFIKELCKMNKERHSSVANSILDTSGIAPCLDTMSGGGREPKVMVIDDQGRKNKKLSPKNIVPTLRSQSHGNDPKIAIRQGTKQGYALAGVGDCINLDFPTSKTRRGRVGRQVANTLLASGNQGVVAESLKIRKLTPRECWRLQGFPDWAFDKAQGVNSNSQLYKQAGNSVTVNVIKAIAERLKER